MNFTYASANELLTMKKALEAYFEIGYSVTDFQHDQAERLYYQIESELERRRLL